MKKSVDHIGVGIVFYCHDGNGNFIMSKRSKNTRDEHDRWDPGGGGVEFGESVDDALRREICLLTIPFFIKKYQDKLK